MDKIPTAEEFFESLTRYDHQEHIYSYSAIERAKEFAELHVEAALKAAADSVGNCKRLRCDDHTPFWGPCVTCGSYDNPEILMREGEIKDAILASYSANNIK